jgi:hypothetical protein
MLFYKLPGLFHLGLFHLVPEPRRSLPRDERHFSPAIPDMMTTMGGAVGSLPDSGAQEMKAYCRRQDLANAAIAASRVASYP